MNKTIIFSVLASVLLLPAQAQQRKDVKGKLNYNKQEVVVPEEGFKENAKVVKITSPEQQLYGEWTIISLRSEEVKTEERPYIYLDFRGGNKVYGNNGCNAINGTFTCDNEKLSFGEMISTMRLCDSQTSEFEIMQAMKDVCSYEVTELYAMQYMALHNEHGVEVMKLRRLNFDLLNGPWVVKEIGGTNVSESNIKLVIDVDMRTINVLTKCNIINGTINIDSRKEFEVQFEDLQSTQNPCDDVDIETQMLINLEEVVSCKRINSKEMALTNKKGQIAIVLTKYEISRSRR